MANKQPLEIARNVITKLDERIAMRISIIKMLENAEHNYMGQELSKDTIEQLLIENNDFLNDLQSLREFVIYKA
jgi:hypothetical protein